MRTWLVKLRMDMGYTQKDIAEEVGISRSYYAEIEQGKLPSGPVAYRISKILNFKMEKFYEEK